MEEILFGVQYDSGSDYTVPNAVDEYLHSSAAIVLNMIKISFLQKFEFLFGFVHLFATRKHQCV